MKVSRIKIGYLDLKVLVISPVLNINNMPNKLIVWEINNKLRCKTIPFECYIEDIENLIINCEET